MRVSLAMMCCLAACSAGKGSDGLQGGEPSILDRRAREPLTCEVISELRGFGLSASGVRDGLADVLQLETGARWAARSTESDVSGRAQLVVTPLSPRGEGGEDRLVDGDAPQVGARELLALPDGGFALLWIRGDSPQALWFAAFDRAGAATVGATQVPGIEPRSRGALRAAVSHSGKIGVLYGGPGGSAQLALLDSSGELASPVREVLSSPAALAAAPGGGFVVLGREVGPDGKFGDALVFSKIDETSEARTAPIPVAQTEEGRSFWDGIALLPLARGYLIAWTEAVHPPSPRPWEYSTGSYALIRLRRLDENGAPLVEAIVLREERDSIAERRPVLATFGEQVALFWSTGAYQYDCEMPEACSHRDRGQLILIDADDLAPRSNLLEVLRDPAYPNGRLEPRFGDLLGTRLSVHGSEVVVTAILQDDDDTRLAPGFASLRCQ